MLRAYDSFDGADTYEDENGFRAAALRFLRSPLELTSWVALLYFAFVSLPFGAIAACWCLFSLGLSVLTFILFPLGPLLVGCSCLSWRFLAMVECKLQKPIIRHLEYDEREYPRVLPYVPQSGFYDFDKTKPFLLWQYFKALVSDSHTWTCFLYFVFLKFPMSLFCCLFSFAMLVLSLSLVFNIVFVLFDPSLAFASEVPLPEAIAWVFHTPKGSAITIPLGLFLFCTTFVLVHFLAEVSHSACFSLLSKRSIAATPLKGKASIYLSPARRDSPAQTTYFYQY